MEYLEWKSASELITLDSNDQQIKRCNITENPHESIERSESFEDFLIDKNLSARSIKSNFSETIYIQILQEVRKRCSEELLKSIQQKLSETINYINSLPYLTDDFDSFVQNKHVIDTASSSKNYIIQGDSTQLQFSFNNKGAFKIIANNTQNSIIDFPLNTNNIYLQNGLYFNHHYYLIFTTHLVVINETGNIIIDHTAFTQLLRLFKLHDFTIIDGKVFVSYFDMTEKHYRGKFCIDVLEKKVLGRIDHYYPKQNT